MLHRPLIVLKFGSSVLTGPQSLPSVVHEIYRWVRRGRRVVAIVSAFEGETNRLLAAARSHGAEEEFHEYAAAALAATGERASAALLTLALDRAGVACECLDEASLSIRAEGPPLDAFPSSIDCAALLRALDRAPAVVIPGFIGRDALGRITALGRGGSDLSALFIAQQIDADCRLVKDVRGLYEWDPALPGPPPRRFESITWEDALDLDGSIVQHKAILFAQAHGSTFEVAALHDDDATTVGAPTSTFAGEPAPDLPPLRVALAGLGVVGGGVYKALRRLPERFEIVAATARNHERAAELGVPAEILCAAHELADRSFDILVEAIGGEELATTIIAGALERGADVVTANKAAIAAHGERLECVAASNGAALRWSAAAGAAAPILEAAARAAAEGPVSRAEAILNGTASFVLDRISTGESLETALAEARRRGLAEQDASRDLDGRDAADKLVLLHHALTGQWIDPGEVRREPINESAPLRTVNTIDTAPPMRHVASLTLDSDDRTLEVRPTTLKQSHPLSALRGEWCGVAIESPGGERIVATGRGAGRWPTTEAVIADLLDIRRQRSRETRRDRTTEPGKECARELV